jgi:hypothetical protein
MAVNYDTFQGGPIILQQGGDIDVDLSFRTPNVDTGKGAQLTFMVNPRGPVQFKLAVNGDEILTQTLDGGPKRAFHENFGGGSLQSSPDNTLRITKTGGTGDVTFSDFMVIYKTP